MKVYIDPKACTGHGRCYTFYGDVYSDDEDGFARHRGCEIEVSPAHEKSAREGAVVCPEGAIQILEE